MVNSKFSGRNIIDGLTTDDDISNMFSSKIALLLNSDLDQSARNSFLADLTDYILKSDLLTSEISSTVVLNALDLLKNGKSDGSSLFSDAFIFAESILSNPLSHLFTAVVRHGYDPKHLRDCILQLIPKPGKDPTCFDNYRQLQTITERLLLLQHFTYSSMRLFLHLTSSSCWLLLAAIGQYFVGALRIADDIVLSAPSACHLGHI